jgi:hypothetical protein
MWSYVDSLMRMMLSSDIKTANTDTSGSGVLGRISNPQTIDHCGKKESEKGRKSQISLAFEEETGIVLGVIDDT